MRPASVLGLVVGGLAANLLQPREYDQQDYYVLQLERDADPVEVASRLGMAHVGRMELPGHHIFESARAEHDVVRREIKERRRKRSLGDVDILDSVKFTQKQKPRQPHQKRLPRPFAGLYPAPREVDRPDEKALAHQKSFMKELGIEDPIFDKQWHLFNPVQVGHDVNVVDLWLEGVTGNNVTVAIVDDGLDMNSRDLAPNYYAEGSYDFNDQRNDPIPSLSDDKHGTRCAGEVAAAKNDVCGLGVAYDSNIAGIRILSKQITDADEAIAMNYDFQHNQIYSCSWGPSDDGQTMDAPGILIKKAMLNGVQKGRDELGSIYVFASGNGASYEDNCNFDGYTNSIYSITVGAVDRKGLHPYYSELCSAQLVVTYSSGSGDNIHTTDVGEDTCSSTHGGTSASAPLAAGIFALALDVRPDLSWRDMQYIAMDTAVPVDPDNVEFQETTIGKKFSHTFGYGKIDSYALVQAAKEWKKVKPQAWYFSPWQHIKHDIPQGEEGLTTSFDVTADMLKEANLERLEHVTVTMNLEHSFRGEVSVDLVSPNGIVSHIATTRKDDKTDLGYDDWTFMSVVHWGESGIGKWTLIVRDSLVNDNKGKLIDWHLKLWGESIDPAKASLLPMPDEHDDDDHDAIPTETATAETTTLPPHPAATNTDTLGVPSDHPERPTKPNQGGEEGEMTAWETGAEATETGADAAEQTATEGEVEPEPVEDESDKSWLPSFLPTFGVSGRTQAWIYGAVALIIVFCAGLGIWFWVTRRKRERNANPRDQYEFQPLTGGDGDGDAGALAPGEKASGGGRRGGRRGGELYDAFADGSEDEEFLDEFDDDADERRRRSSDDDQSSSGSGSGTNEKRGGRQ